MQNSQPVAKNIFTHLGLRLPTTKGGYRLLIGMLCFMLAGISVSAKNEWSFKELIHFAKNANDLDSAFGFATEAYNIATTPGEKAIAQYELARYNVERSKLAIAFGLLDDALKTAVIENDSSFQGNIYLARGRCYQLSQNYASALENLTKGLNILELVNDKEGMLRANVNLAEYYRNLNKYPEALFYIHQSFAIAQQIREDKFLQIQLYNRAAAVYSEIGKTDSSIYYSFKALKISKEIHRVSSEAVSYNEIAFMMENKNKLKEALIYYERANQIWTKSQSARYLLNVRGNIARVYHKLKDYKKSSEILFTLIDIAEKNGWYSNSEAIYRNLEENYAILGDETRMYKFRALRLDARLKVYQEENARELDELKTKYHLDKNEYLLKKQQDQINLANIQFQNKRKETIGLWIGFVGVLLFCMVVSILLIQRSRNLRELNQRNAEIELTNQQLKSNLLRIEALVQEVHHRVKNNLQFIYSIMELEISANKEKKENSSLLGMQRRIMGMSLVHELLYSKDNIENISAKKYLRDLIDYLDILLNSKELGVKFELEAEEIRFDANQCIAIGMIASELIANAFKYAFKTQKNPEIGISIRRLQETSEIRMVIRDNGSGFIREENSNHGLGHRLVDIFTSQLNGTYTIDSLDKTVFTFIFPPQA